jgi:hypothetical protein
MKMRKGQHDDVQLGKLVGQHDLGDVPLRSGGNIPRFFGDTLAYVVIGRHEFHAASCSKARLGKKLAAELDQFHIEQALHAKLFRERQADLVARRALAVGSERKQLLAMLAENSGVHFQHISGSSCAAVRVIGVALSIAGGAGPHKHQGGAR